MLKHALLATLEKMHRTPPQKVTTKSPVPPPVVAKQPDRDVTRRERLDPAFAEVASPPAPVSEEEPPMSDEEKAAMFDGWLTGIEHFTRLSRMSKPQRDQFIIDFQHEKGIILTPQMLDAFDACIWG